MASRTSPGPATLRLLETGIRCFREGGFSIALAAHAISTIDSFVHGFVLQEVNLPFRDESQLVAMTRAIMETFPAAEFPYLFELTVEHVLQPGYDYGQEFDSGLKIVLEESLRCSSGTAQMRPPLWSRRDVRGAATRCEPVRTWMRSPGRPNRLNTSAGPSPGCRTSAVAWCRTRPPHRRRERCRPRRGSRRIRPERT